MKVQTVLLGLVLSVLGSACDVADLVPTTAADAGKASARVAVTMDALPSKGMANAVAQFELTVVDVLLHRVEDDMWIIANDGTGTLRAGTNDTPLAFTGLPVGLGDYDRILIALEGARVGIDGRWVDVQVTTTELELDYSWSVDEETELSLVLDLQEALVGNDKNWVLTPTFSAHARPSSP